MGMTLKGRTAKFGGETLPRRPKVDGESELDSLVSNPLWQPQAMKRTIAAVAIKRWLAWAPTWALNTSNVRQG